MKIQNLNFKEIIFALILCSALETVFIVPLLTNNPRHEIIEKVSTIVHKIELIQLTETEVK